MAKLPGLFQRGNTFYLRVMVPKDLRPLYAGQGKLIRTLETSVPSIAKVVGTQHRANALALFSQQRGVQAPTIAKSWNPPQATAPRQAPAITLRDIHTRWAASKQRSADSVASCLRAVVLFEQFADSAPPLQTIDRKMGDAFRAWLIEPSRNTAPKTARDRLTWLKSLLKYAAQDLELLSRNPWQGLEIAARTTQKRRPWTDDELRRYFGRPMFTNCAFPADTKAGGEAAYWIPLLALFTGARLGELAQLHPRDISTSDCPCISITNEGENQRVKSFAGLRRVPIHPELVRLGFLDYVALCQSSKSESLWPKLPKRKDKAGGFFSQWFGEDRRSAGLTGACPDFHCYRHTVRTQLAEANISEPLIDALLGHEAKGSTGAKVYTHRSIAALQAAINCLSYPVIAQIVSPRQGQDTARLRPSNPGGCH